MANLEGKRVFVIGGTSGIGLAAAVLARAAGAEVTAVSRSADKVANCQAQYSDIEFAALDIHDQAALGNRLAEGQFDHIVAAATGANRTIAPFLEQTEDQFQEAFNKFWGYANVARLGIPHLRKGGSLTLISGTPARKCSPGMSAVSCTGAAVEALVRALAQEVAPCRVNAVAPGIIDTGMFDRFGDNKAAALEGMGKNILLGRVGAAEEVAQAVLLLMNNPYMTGTVLDVDGGALLP